MINNDNFKVILLMVEKKKKHPNNPLVGIRQYTKKKSTIAAGQNCCKSPKNRH